MKTEFGHLLGNHFETRCLRCGSVHTYFDVLPEKHLIIGCKDCGTEWGDAPIR